MHDALFEGRLRLAFQQVAVEHRGVAHFQLGNALDAAQKVGRHVDGRGHDQVIGRVGISILAGDAPSLGALLHLRHGTTVAQDHLSGTLAQTLRHALLVEVEALDAQHALEARQLQRERLHAVQVIERRERADAASRAGMGEHADEVVADALELTLGDHLVGGLVVQLADERILLQGRAHLHDLAVVLESLVVRQKLVVHEVHVAHERRRVEKRREGERRMFLIVIVRIAVAVAVGQLRQHVGGGLDDVLLGVEHVVVVAEEEYGAVVHVVLIVVEDAAAHVIGEQQIGTPHPLKFQGAVHAGTAGAHDDGLDVFAFHGDPPRVVYKCYPTAASSSSGRTSGALRRAPS